MNNRWAKPAGFDGPKEKVAPVYYTILVRLIDGTRVPVLRETERASKRYVNPDGSRTMMVYHSLAALDQHFADTIIDLIQEAACYFSTPPGYEPPVFRSVVADLDPPISDYEVLQRMERLAQGENTREAARTSRRRYPLRELPWETQRALIERITLHQRTWEFEILGEVPEEESEGVKLVADTERVVATYLRDVRAGGVGNVETAQRKAVSDNLVAEKQVRDMRRLAAYRAAESAS